MSELQSLAELFPQVPSSQLQRALCDSDGDVNAAATLLLSGAMDTLSSAPKPPPQSKGAPKGPTTAAPSQRSAGQSKTWNTVSQELLSKGVTGIEQQKYASARFKMEEDSFPSLVGGQRPSTTPAGIAMRSGGGWTATARATFDTREASNQPEHNTVVPDRVRTTANHQPLLKSTAPSRVRSNFASILKQDREPASQNHPRAPAADALVITPAPVSKSQLEALCALHKWASQEIIKAVHESVDHDIEATCRALAEMSAQPRPLPDERTNGGASVSTETEVDDSHSHETAQQQDVYWRHRGAASQLSNEWRRLMKRAAAHFAVGADSEARSLLAEAQRVRRRADVAHAEAAQRIEEEMNRGRPVDELDLHGLHVGEALAAVERRVAALAALPYDASRPRRTLRVVVGLGSHSSGEEGVMEAAVTGYLHDAGLRFVPRAGSLLVDIPRGIVPTHTAAIRGA